MVCFEDNSTPESFNLALFVYGLGDVKEDHKDMRVNDQLLVETSPVIFSAKEISMFMWVCGLLISCLKSTLWWVVCVSTGDPI